MINIFKLSKFISKGDKDLFDLTLIEQENILRKLGVPQDDFERSHKQYSCQSYLMSKTKIIVLNIFALIFCPIYIGLNIIKGFGYIKQKHLDAIGDFNGFEEIIPSSLREEFKINNLVWFENSHLKFSDLLFIMKIISRYPFSAYFIFKNVVKIAKYSYMINSYSPIAIIVHNEYSYTSSILTHYCEKHGIKHINVMHGEKLFYIRDTFFRYTECYVWNNYYKKLFISLRAESTQFKVAVPPSLSIDCDKYYDPGCFADYKYYLATYTESELRSIIHSMEFAVRQGKKVYFRPHPRYSDFTLLESFVDKARIEYPDKVSILTSVASLDYAVGSYTTVLNQAYFSGKKVVLDDMTFFKQFKKLEDYQYILQNRNCIKLSDLQ